MPASSAVKKFISSLEESRAPFVSFVLTFLSFVFLRNFLEHFSSHEPILAVNYLHYLLFYVVMLQWTALCLYAAVRVPFIRIFRVLVPCCAVILVPPILDLVISGGQGLRMVYLMPGVHDDLWRRFLTFFGSIREVGMGITPGIQVEVFLILMASLGYMRLKGAGWLRSLFFVFVLYGIFFAFGAVPFLVRGIAMALNLPSASEEIGNMVFIKFYTLMMMGLFGGIFSLGWRAYFWQILKDLRVLRILHYELLLVLGMVLRRAVLPVGAPLTLEALFDMVLMALAILFAGLFSLATNNMADYKIDQISNRSRPLVTRAIPLEVYQRMGWIFLGLALLGAGVVSFRMLFYVGLFIGCYFLYSMPPIRFKRVLILSKGVIALNSFVMLTAGYFLERARVIAHYRQDVPVLLEIHHAPFGISPTAVLVFFMFLMIPLNFIDLKDREGDRAAGIRTLPVMMGMRPAQQIIGAGFLAAYIGTVVILRPYVDGSFRWLLVTAVGMGLIQVCLVGRRRYDERPVFLVHLVTLLGLIGLLW